MKTRWTRYVLHISLWVFLYFLPYLFSFRGKSDIHSIFSDSGDVIHLISFTLLIVYSYANYLWMVPQFYLKKKYLAYFLMVLVSIFVVIKMPQFFEPPRGSMPHGFRPDEGPLPILFGMNYTIILFLISTSLAIGVQQRLQLIRMEKEKLNAELSFLKAQINPHFLFNTLNSIYSLALVKSDETPKTITQLSELMRYILRDSKSGHVELINELNYIKNYIELQKRRLGHTVTIKYSAPVYTGKKKIAPLLLMSFIENAFQHGVNPDRDSAITIEISVDQHRLYLSTNNNKVDAVSDDELSGIDLNNTRDRLLHLYPGRHALEISEDKEHFSVHLVIELE